MDVRGKSFRGDQGPEVGALLPQAISLDEAEDIADEVRDLLSAGDGHTAWERIRHPTPPT